MCLADGAAVCPDEAFSAQLMAARAWKGRDVSVSDSRFEIKAVPGFSVSFIARSDDCNEDGIVIHGFM